MEKFKARTVNDDLIELESSSDLENLYNTIEKEENFIVEWLENGVKKASVIIGNNLLSKVKSGNLQLLSSQVNGGK